jgi:hypothetical protein
MIRSETPVNPPAATGTLSGIDAPHFRHIE